MKLWPVTTLAKSNMATLKKFDDDAISVNRDLILIFPIYGKFGAIRKPDSGHMVCKTYIFINSSLLCYKNWKQNQKISNTALILLFWILDREGVILPPPQPQKKPLKGPPRLELMLWSQKLQPELTKELSVLISSICML